MMSEETLDPRRQKLVAALYGELSDEEELEFQALLAEDPGLREDWEELRQTRSLLAGWTPEQTSLGFEITAREAALRGPVVGKGSSSPGFWTRIRRGWTPPAWGFAGATATLVILILVGFRVDWVENGVMFRFGQGPETSSVSDPGAGISEARDQEGLDLQRIDPPREGIRATPVSAVAPVTREEMDYYSAGMMQIMSEMLAEYRDKRNGELAYILGSLYEQLRSEQREQYDDLKARVEGVGLGLMVEQSRANARLEYLMSPTSERGEKP